MSRTSPGRPQKLWARFLRLSLALLTGVCLASPASAQCSFSSGSSLSTATIALPTTLSVSRDAAVGTVVYDSNWVATSATTSINCSSATTMKRGYQSAMVVVPGSANVFQTGVNGIGIKVAWANGMSGSPTMDGVNSVLWPASSANVPASDYGPMGRFRVQLIVTGNVSAGTFTLPAALAQATYGSIMVNNLLLTNNNASVKAAACSVQTPSIPVVMPQAKISALPTVGSTTGDTAIPISLNCSAPVSIYVTFTDASNPSNVGNTLSLTSNSSAKGVAYQILYGSTVINYGADSSAVGNQNQVKLGSVSAAGSFPISLSARYVRTGAIVPGSANALATFTMSYQ
jgi:hypothetical protein